MSKFDILHSIKKHKLVAILRGVSQDKIPNVVESLYNGGIRNIEITFNQKSLTKIQDTKNMLTYVTQTYGDKMYVGAGTVISVEEVHAAYEAGAKFILAPNMNCTVIEEAVRLNMAAIPGALTPTEVVNAYDMGATAVKLFPVGDLPLSYCKSIMAPINHIPMIAVGGIDHKNLKDYLDIGFIGAGIGSSLTNKILIEEENYEELENLTRKYTNVNNHKR